MKQLFQIALTMLVALVTLFSGCYRFNQKTRAVELLTEYSIYDLKGYFESTVWNSADEQNSDQWTIEEYQPIFFNDAESVFGDYSLRRVPTSNFDFVYTAYRVKEGGLYYVQWSLDETDSPYECLDRIYLKKLSPNSELKTIKRGDPYSKLERIDINSIITYRSALMPIAYSLASNGKVYGFELMLNDDDDYMITGISDCSDKNILIAMILKEDYPKDGG